MVRMQGDFAKAPEKRFNYKHCFDGLYRVSPFFFPSLVSVLYTDPPIRWFEKKVVLHFLEV